jgi:hypothetical protein
VGHLGDSHVTQNRVSLHVFHALGVAADQEVVLLVISFCANDELLAADSRFAQ